MTMLFVEASEAARRLFIRKGFAQVKRRDFLLPGVSIHNYLMEKKLLFRVRAVSPLSTQRGNSN
jgi:putative acetyltransferase